MNLASAIRRIQSALFELDDQFGGVAFDEWFLVSLVGLDRTVLHYAGPRYEHNANEFIENIRPMARELIERRHRVGNVDFAPDGIGPGFDAMITLGAGYYAILNDTTGSTEDLQQHKNWKTMEERLIQMGSGFRQDPLSISGESPSVTSP